jgi:hypothetical protein
VPRLRMSGTISPLHSMPLWCIHEKLGFVTRIEILMTMMIRMMIIVEQERKWIVPEYSLLSMLVVEYT